MQSGMEQLAFMIGAWTIEAYHMGEDGEWIASPPNQTNITSLFDGMFLQEYVSVVLSEMIYNAYVMWSYDKFRQMFRMMTCNNVEGHIDVLEGNFEDGVMIVSNLHTNTAYVAADGNEVNVRLLSTKTSDDSFTDVVQETTDGGAYWYPVYRAVHTRNGGIS